MLKATNLGKQIGGKKLLIDCSLHLKPGNFTAVVGPNGAGKTTLLKAISGESRQYSGSISINGKKIQSYKARELSLVRAILPQHTVVNFPFTVEQVIEIGRYPHRTSKRENMNIISEAMELTGITGYSGRTYQTLSGGEKQRVQMARVIAQTWDESTETKYVLLDEPTAGLDLAQQHTIVSQAKELCQRNIAIMAVLHDLNLAIQYADEILFLKKGSTIAYGNLQQVISKEIIEETYEYPVRLLNDQGELIVVPSHKRKHGNETAKEKRRGLCRTFSSIPIKTG